ncbi:MAG: pyridoxamine 5'-phosphate oxidase family protein [Acidimicrobiales bacterium]
MLTDDQGVQILDDGECRRLLGTAQLGRIGLILGEVPAVFPVNYFFSDDAIWFRTGPGVKLDAAEAGETVAFEVDDVDHSDEEAWSVLAIGTPSIVTDAAVHEIAARVPLLPWAPDTRDHLVRVNIAFLSGRRISRESTPSRPRE